MYHTPTEHRISQHTRKKNPNLAQLAAGMYKIYILYLSSEPRPRPRLRPSQKTPRSHKPLTLRTTISDLEYPASRKHQQTKTPQEASIFKDPTYFRKLEGPEHLFNARERE